MVLARMVVFRAAEGPNVFRRPLRRDLNEGGVVWFQ